MIKVRALVDVYVNNTYRTRGSVFFVHDHQFCRTTLQKVGDDVPIGAPPPVADSGKLTVAEQRRLDDEAELERMRLQEAEQRAAERRAAAQSGEPLPPVPEPAAAATTGERKRGKGE